MHRVRELLQEVLSSTDLAWDVSGSTVTVRLGESGRSQRVTVAEEGNTLALRSLVLSGREVTRTSRRWHDLARQAWRRNTQKQLVCFTFDDQDQLIGQILQPADTLDPEELVLYLNTLARECDEYEYRLSGEDRF